MRVLVVDDSRVMRMLVRRTVRQAELGADDIDEAEDALEAWRLIRRTPYDLILSDWNMPRMTGIELLRRLRGAGLDVPFGFVTVECTKEAHDAAQKAGAAFLLSKPVTVESLRAAVDRALASKAA
jgi:two-component system chemotaxis response regulator CheY